MRKISLLCFLAVNFILVFFLVSPLVNNVHAEVVADGDVCNPSTDTCSDPNGRCDVDPNGDGTRTICQTPPPPVGSACKATEDKCAINQICSPNSPGSEDGTCKVISEGTPCNPDLKNSYGNITSCGSYVNSDYECKPDATRGGNTCQKPACDVLDVGYLCDEDKPNYYCVQDKDGSRSCKFSTNPPEAPPPPPVPCSKNGYDPATKKCTSFNTGLGILSTDPASFIRSIFGVLLAAAGSIALLLIIRAGYQIMTSQGKPESIQEGREKLISAIVGLLFLIFALVFLEVLGLNLLRIPGIGGA